MNEDPLGRLVAFFAFAVLIVFGVSIIFSLIDHSIDTKISNETVSFTNTCASNGCIYPEDIYNFIGYVTRLGNYTVIIEHESSNYFTDGNGGANKEYISHFTDEIMTSIFHTDGTQYTYEMKADDYINVTVKKNSSILTGLLDLIRGTTQSSHIIADYGAPVGQN